MKTLSTITLGILCIAMGMMFISCEEDQAPQKAPTSPTKIKATVSSSTKIVVSWNDNSDNEDGFRIERACFDSLFYETIARVSANSISYSDSGLNAMTSYAYRVFAYNNGGESRPSSVSVGTTLRAPVPPNTPFQLRAVTVGTTKVYLAWQDNSSNEVGFKIERSLAGLNAFFGVDTVGVNLEYYEVNNLTEGTPYDFRVLAYNTNGNSGYTNIASATPGLNAIPPLPPSNLIASAVSASQVALVWTDNSTNETGFRLERAPAGTILFARIATLPPLTRSYRDLNLLPSTAYSYRVRAFNSIDSSNYSGPVEVTTQAGSGVPGAPTNLRGLVKSPSQVWLSWTDNATNEDGYTIERAPGSTTNFSALAWVTANETTYHVAGLTPSTTYSFRVRAFALADSSPYSGSITRTTTYLSNRPAAPTNLRILGEETATDIGLTWQDNSGNEDGFYVERAPVGTLNYVQIDIVDIGIITYADYSVQQATGYSYRVRSFNAAGASSYTNPATGLTKTQTETRFINGASHSVISVIIDSIQYLASREEIAPNRFLPITLPVGRHYYSMKNGYWNGDTPVVLYSDTGQFIQSDGISGKVSFTDPSIYRIMTKFKYSGYWEAQYNSGSDSVGFRFFTDGSYFYYTNGTQHGSGLYNLVHYSSNYVVTFTIGTYEGTLSELPGDNYFTMPNGPTGEPVLKYYYKKP